MFLSMKHLMCACFQAVIQPNGQQGPAHGRVAFSALSQIILLLVLSFIPTPASAKEVITKENLWSLKPRSNPAVPMGVSSSGNPIDAFIAQASKDLGVTPLEEADKLTWLRRVSYDLVGLPPTPREQETFLQDDSSGAYQKVADRLLASDQHGVRYGRHWLDILRYADLDDNMPAAPGIHFWRDWVITALNRDLPYDEFVRAQICGNRAAQRRIISAAGHLTPVQPRPEDLFALGFLSRGAAIRADTDQQLAISAVETISSAFLGLTVGCAKCHDHFYDPISQAEFYSMKALFDPLVLRPVDLAAPAQVFAQGRAVDDYESRLKVLVDAMRRYIDPYHRRLYEERLSALPKEAQAAIRKPEKARTVPEQKLSDDYHPILRIDPVKVKAIMPPAEIKQYEAYLREIRELKPPDPLPVFWAVEEDAKRAAEKSYILTTGDPTRPRLNQEVQPGFPLAPKGLEFHSGRRETFADWLTAAENPLFARVAVNRIWQWHFTAGLHEATSDFGALGGKPVHPLLLDWLASEFIKNQYSMRWLHRLIVTSETYRRASTGPKTTLAANQRLDPQNRCLWFFPLKRLEAEPVRDAALFVAGSLDLSVGGKSFEDGKSTEMPARRTMFMARGYRSFADVMPDFLQTFDADDGRVACARRTQTVTAPQALFMMNNGLIEEASTRFAERLRTLAVGNLNELVQLGFNTALGRPPKPEERVAVLDFLQGDPERVKGFTWMLFNTDEFVYVR